MILLKTMKAFGQKQQKELTENANRLAREFTDLQAQLVAAAERIMDHEADIGRLTGQLAALEAEERAKELIGLAEEERSAISEPMIARAVSRELPEGHGLFLGNSMPVRDLDFFAAARGDRPLFGANRGVSGIDGTISSGFGFSTRPFTSVRAPSRAPGSTTPYL